MSDKRYPTRMHEVLGVEANEDFIVSFPGDGEYQQADFECFVDDGGNFKYKKHPELPPSIHIINYAINRGITRRPRLTEEQVQVMKALVTIGCLWLVQDNDCYTYAAVNKPTKRSEHWSIDAESFTIYVDRPSGCLISLVSWSDPAPIDIVQTLRGAGVSVEVEG